MLLAALALLIYIFYLLAKICDEYFVQSLETITKRLKISNDVAGATFMAIGSSAPELFTSIIALTKVGIENVGTGTIVGSAIFNVLVIIGAAAIVREVVVQKKSVLRDLGFYILTLILLLVTFWDGIITLPEASLYILLYGLYIFVLSQWRKWVPQAKPTIIEPTNEVIEESRKKLSLWARFDCLNEKLIGYTFPNIKKHPNLYGVTFTISIVYIAVLSWGMVELAVFIAHGIGIPESIIALTVLAAGTSVPDMMSSIIASRKGHGNMAVSNAIGSNTFDILIGLGAPWLIFILLKDNPISVGNENLISSIILLFGTVVLLALFLIGKGFSITKKEGIALVSIYGAYIIISVLLVINPDLFNFITPMTEAVFG